MNNAPRTLLALLAFLLTGLTLSACLTPPRNLDSASSPTPTATLALPTATPTPAPTATPTPTQTRRATPTSASSPTPTSVTLRVDEAELNRAATKALSNNPNPPLQNLRVDLRPGLVVVSGRAAVGLFPVNLEIVAVANVVNGKIVPEITEVRMAGNPAPAFVRDQVEQQAQPVLSAVANLDPSLYVETAEITNDEIIVTGKRQ